MKRILLIAVLVITASLTANAAFVRDMPVARLQPNGDTLHCFATGDEFYHRLHDANGFTIIQDPATGWYVYADRQWNNDAQEWFLTPTALIPEHDNPAAAGIASGLVEARSIVDTRHKHMQVPPQYVPETLRNRTLQQAKDANHGTLNNVVIFIRFADDSAIATPYSTIHDMFNDSSANAVSLHNYFWRASYGNIRIPTYFFPTPSDNTVISYQDSLPRSRFLPYNAATNPDGYNGDQERALMEFGLLERAVNYVNQNSPVPSSINIDHDNDGLVDNICFVIKGTYTGWSDLLWPHKWSLYDRYVFLNGKRVYTFNLQLEGSGSHYFSTSTFCHEMFHTLGAPDLYHYENYSNVTGVGIWDLMCNNTTPPQHMSMYMKMRYGHWIDSVPELTEAGTYSLHSVGDSVPHNNCYRINAGNPSQWYYLEYRDNTELFETGLPGSGLIVFRTDSRFNGNANFDAVSNFDEVYVFRPDAINDTTNGTSSQAFFSLESGRTSFTPYTNPFPWLSGNEIDTTIYITDIGSAGDSITFTYTPHQPAPAACDSSCNLIVTMNDQYGDTWNGAYLTLKNLDGEVFANLSIGDCKMQERRVVPVCGEVIIAEWHHGRFDNECDYNVRLEDGTLLYSVNNPSGSRTIYSPCSYEEPQTYTITVQSSDTINTVYGGGNDFLYGDEARIHAYPAANYEFVGWHDGTGNDSTIHNSEQHRTVIVTSDSLFTAIFRKINLTFTVSATPAEGCEGMGTVSGTGAFSLGDTATLTATANAGYVFDRWTYAHTQTAFYDNPLSFVVDRSSNYWAWFKSDGTSGVATTDEQQVQVTSSNGSIIIRRAEGHRLEVYDIMGRLHYSDSHAAETVTVGNIPAAGIYIVHIDGLPTQKVVVIKQ